MTTNPGKHPPITIAGELQNLQEDIRRRAYQLYEARGREEGHDLDDWLRAEEELTSKSRTVAA